MDTALVVSKQQREKQLALSASNTQKSIIATDGVPRTSTLQAPIMQLLGQRGAIYSLKFNPAGTTLATSSFDKTVFLWNVYGDCKNYLVIEGHKSAVLDVHWSRDGSKIISASADKMICIHDAESGKKIKKLSEHESYVNSCCPSRKDDFIVSGSDDNTAKLWDIRQRSSAHTFTHKYQVTAVCFSEEGHQIFTGSIDNDIRAWDLRKNDIIFDLQGHTDTVTGLALSPDGSYVLSNAMDNHLLVWDVRPYAPQQRCVKIFQGHEHNIEKNLLKCSWSPDGSKVSCGSADRFVYIWDTPSRNILYKLPGHMGSVNDVVFHPHEPIIASCSSDMSVFLGEIEK